MTAQGCNSAIHEASREIPRTLLFGATSLLGYHLAQSASTQVLPYRPPGKTGPTAQHWPALQLHDPQWVRTCLRGNDPDLLLYAHAVCDVPKCEQHPEWAYEVNVNHVRRVLSALPSHTRVVYLSSDHVFGGDGAYAEDSPPCPISVYGRTRLAAEAAVLSRPRSLVIRPGLGLGASPDGRTGHVDWLRYRLGKGLPVTIIEDEVRSAVWVADLAWRILRLAQSPENGLRHLAATRAVSRVELAHHLVARLNLPPTFRVEGRRQQAAPHLGHVELATRHHDQWSEPLPSILDPH